MIISKYIVIILIIKSPGQSSNLWAFPWRYDILWLFPLGTVDGIIVIIMTEEGGLTAKRAASPGKLLFRTQPEVLLLNFWPAWYLFFRASIPPMVKLYDELHRRAAETRAKYLGLVLDRPRASFARSFLQKIKLSYPQPWAPSLLVCSDFLHSTQELASARKIKEIPVVYVLNIKERLFMSMLRLKRSLPVSLKNRWLFSSRRRNEIKTAEMVGLGFFSSGNRASCLGSLGWRILQRFRESGHGLSRLYRYRLRPER
ncbi:MAG: hypothetical protein ACUVR0_06385 [Candidatus Aminicenantales bacterium]